jgi:hypothetical protein
MGSVLRSRRVNLSVVERWHSKGVGGVIIIVHRQKNKKKLPVGWAARVFVSLSRRPEFIFSWFEPLA